MKKVIGMMVGALVCSLAVTAFAAGGSPEHLSRIGMTNNNLGLLVATDGAWDGGGCADNGWLAIDTSTDNGRLMYQTALAAYLAGRVVMAYYTPGVCIDSNPKAERIDIAGP